MWPPGEGKRCPQAQCAPLGLTEALDHTVTPTPSRVAQTAPANLAHHCCTAVTTAAQTAPVNWAHQARSSSLKRFQVTNLDRKYLPVVLPGVSVTSLITLVDSLAFLSASK